MATCSVSARHHSMQRSVHASSAVGFISSSGKISLSGPPRPTRFPDELLTESTSLPVSSVRRVFRGWPSSETPLGGPPSFRATALRGETMIGEASCGDGPALPPPCRASSPPLDPRAWGVQPLSGSLPDPPRSYPRSLSSCSSSATASAPPSTSYSANRFGAMVVSGSSVSPMRTPWIPYERSRRWG